MVVKTRDDRHLVPQTCELGTMENGVPFFAEKPMWIESQERWVGGNLYARADVRLPVVTTRSYIHSLGSNDLYLQNNTTQVWTLETLNITMVGASDLRGDIEDSGILDDKTFPDLLVRDDLTACHDCAADPGEEHLSGCDVERCSSCWHQRLGCECDDHDPAKSIWTGIWPGTLECELLGWYSWWDPTGRGRPEVNYGWTACDKDHPDGQPDMNRFVELLHSIRTNDLDDDDRAALRILEQSAMWTKTKGTK